MRRQRNEEGVSWETEREVMAVGREEKLWGHLAEKGETLLSISVAVRKQSAHCVLLVNAYERFFIFIYFNGFFFLFFCCTSSAVALSFCFLYLVHWSGTLLLSGTFPRASSFPSI